jgi:hypothetical protein
MGGFADSLRGLMVHPLGGNNHWSRRDSALNEIATPVDVGDMLFSK